MMFSFCLVTYVFPAGFLRNEPQIITDLLSYFIYYNPNLRKLSVVICGQMIKSNYFLYTYAYLPGKGLFLKNMPYTEGNSLLYLYHGYKYVNPLGLDLYSILVCITKFQI